MGVWESALCRMSVCRNVGMAVWRYGIKTPAAARSLLLMSYVVLNPYFLCYTYLLNPHFLLKLQRPHAHVLLNNLSRHKITLVLVIRYIGVVSVYMQYNCVYYCDTCYIPGAPSPSLAIWQPALSSPRLVVG
jgi:hypothetical protein